MIALDFTQAEEAQIVTAAQQTGLAPAEYIKQLVKDNLPNVQANEIPIVDKENALAIAQLQAWMREEATDNPEEIRKSEADLNELMQNLNRNRVESGERPLFP